MIRQHLADTKRATFCVEFCNPLPTPAGTGFFVSPDGWFVTAAHVITENNCSDGPVRKDIAEAWLDNASGVSGMVRSLDFIQGFGHDPNHCGYAAIELNR